MKRDTFLELCEKSSQDAYEAFRQLLAGIENPTSRGKFISFGHDLYKFLLANYSSNEMIRRYHFSFSNLTLRQQDGKATEMVLLQFPSTFAPEDWSFTFFEGLARYRPSEFQDRSVVELGCGIGRSG